MNLRTRILSITALLMAASAVASWQTSRQLAERIIEEWGVRYAEKQVLYDKTRTLQPILREVALARQLCDSPTIKKWAKNPGDASLMRQSIEEMEGYRKNFAEKSYFVAMLKNGHYYYNNAGDEFAGRQFRYVLDSTKPEDSWFYDLVRQGRDLHINVNPDVSLGVTKIWIDVLIRQGDEILGVGGTGLDLTAFLKDVVESSDPGITSLFVDKSGAIQLYRDQSMIDFGSITKDKSKRNDISLLLERKEDQEKIYAAMKEVEIGSAAVKSHFIEIKGKRYLAGLAYIPEIHWHEITLIDLETLLPISSFSGVLLVYVFSLLAALVVFYLMLSRFILQPLKSLKSQMDSVQAGRPIDESVLKMGNDEIGQLMRHFKSMAKAVNDAKHDLEGKVRARTEQLEYQSKTDLLTELLNRRGMSERITTEIVRARRENRLLGLMWIDADHFKQINDQHGHPVGDQALIAIGASIRSVLRPYDCASRWGGDEFMAMFLDCDAAALRAIAERLLNAVKNNRDVVLDDGTVVAMSVTIGCALLSPDDDFERLLHKADQALYFGKEKGRDQYQIAGSLAG